jgi:hypothetical protein
MPELKMKLANFVAATAKQIRSKTLNAEALEARRAKLAASRSGSASHTRRVRKSRAKETLSTPQRILREKQHAKVQAARVAAAKARASRSGSSTRKSPHSRAGNAKLTFRNGSGKEVTKAVKNITEEDGFYLDSRQMDKLISYQIAMIQGFRK